MSSSQENICNVCFEPIGKTNSTVTPCGHQFCFKCIIKAYQRNPSCPCCREPLNDAEPESSDIEEDEPDIGYNPTPWRRYHWKAGRIDFEDPDCYCYPAIIETVHDIDLVMCAIGNNTEEGRIRVIMHLIDPSYKFGDGVYDVNDMDTVDADNLKDLCAIECVKNFKDIFDLYKKTQIIKKYAEKHIKNQIDVCWERFAFRMGDL